MEFVRMQLQDLYGPMQFNASCNAQFFVFDDKLHEAYRIEYIEPNWSGEYGTRERIKKTSSPDS